MRGSPRADMMDTKVGQGEKADPAGVAKVGFEAMMRGDGDIVAGWTNKLHTAVASGHPGRNAGSIQSREPGCGSEKRETGVKS
jgi:hypothetical protein